MPTILPSPTKTSTVDIACLPENNRNYIWQLAYLVVALIFMDKTPEAFTSLAVLMFVMPITIDIFYARLKHPLFNFFKSILFLLNVFMLFICVSNLFGVLEDKTYWFEVVGSAMILPGFQICKQVLFGLLSFDLCVPIVLYVGTPCQKQLNLIATFNRLIKK